MRYCVGLFLGGVIWASACVESSATEPVTRRSEFEAIQHDVAGERIDSDESRREARIRSILDAAARSGNSIRTVCEVGFSGNRVHKYRVAADFKIDPATDVSSGEEFVSPWFGALSFDSGFDFDAGNGWLFHNQHGWLYRSGGNWYWRHSQQRWTHISEASYPFVYVHELGWYYFYEGSPEFPKRQWFSSFREANGVRVPYLWERWFHHTRNDVNAFRLEHDDFETDLELVLAVDDPANTESEIYSLFFDDGDRLEIPLFGEEGTYEYEIIDAARSLLRIVLSPVGEPSIVFVDEIHLTFDSANEGRYRLVSEDGEYEEEGWFFFR